MIPTFEVTYDREAAWAWVKLPPWLGTRSSDSLFNPLELSAGVFSSGGLFWIDVDAKRRIRAARDAGKVLPSVLIVDETYKRKAQ